MNEKKGIFLIILIFSSVACSATSIGALPSNIDLGTVERGETITQEIYIRTDDVNQNITLNPTANGESPVSLFNGEFEGGRLSEVSASDWWDFPSKEIDPSTVYRNPDTEMSNPPTVQGRVEATVTVPEDAEPGVRHGYIHLNTDISNSGDGGEVGLVAPTRIRYSINVPGRVERDIVVQNVRGIRTESDEASVEVLLSNEGTVTVTAESFNIELQRGEDTIKTLTASGLRLEPGESQYTNAYWSGSNVEEGTYYVDGQVDFLTENERITGNFNLDAGPVRIRPADSPTTDDETREGGSVPIWFVIIVLTILGVLMWGFEIEPFWIVAILGVVGISAFILLSGLPNFLLAVLLIMVGIIIYGGM